MTSNVFAQVGNNSSVLNPNLASAEELNAMEGMNETLIQKIIDNRPLSTNTQLNALLGTLNAEQKSKIYVKLFLPINLNTASNEEIMLVPGITSRMAHEFDEYRPYVSLEQFRREIGKYVDEAEVARFEQYVFIPMDLNTTSSESFASIPGMSNRMVHEFEEYKPYASIEQFRREIGKYVDYKEVARLERYIFIK